MVSQGQSVRIEASAVTSEAVCPGCGRVSSRAHSRYVRRLSDAAVGGQEVLLRLRVRRFFCDNRECARRTFAEQIPDRCISVDQAVENPHAVPVFDELMTEHRSDVPGSADHQDRPGAAV